MTERASQWRKGYSHSDRQALCQSDVIATWLRHCQRPCPLRRSAPALPKGEPWAKRQSLTEYPKPLPLGEVSPKVTERASPWRKGRSHSDRHRLLLKRYDRCVKASTLASLPSQALRASSPKGRAFAEEEKPRGISKASPFGRGVTEGDGEGKPVRGEPLTQRWAGSLSERCYRIMAASLSASLPSQALRASSPKGRAFRDGL